MPIIAHLAGTVRYTGDQTITNSGALEITDAGGFEINLTVTEFAALASAERFKRLGVGLTIAGAAIPDRDLAKDLVIEESADTYGDRLSFKLAGYQYSPEARALLRSRASVDVDFVYGSPWNEYARRVFRGYVVQSTFDAAPPVATVSALDASALYARKRAPNYALPPNSGKTRLEVTRDLLTIGGIPEGRLDLGANGGGVLSKPVTPGDRYILEFLRDFLDAIGVEVGFVDGRFTANRYDAAEPPVVELHAGNLCVPAGIATPDVLAPNVLGVVAVSVTREEINAQGQRETVTSVVTVALHAPVHYAFVQTNVAGEAVLTPYSGPEQAPTIEPISEVITRTTYLGNLEQRVHQTEKAWYAEHVARNVIVSDVDPPGYALVPQLVYIYPDGSSRARPVEIWQTIRETVKVKDVDGNNNVIHVREERRFPRMFRSVMWWVTWTVGGIVDTLAADGAAISDDGDALLFAVEKFGLFGADEAVDVTIDLASDGTIHTETTRELAFMRGSPRARTPSAYGFGLDARTYWSDSAEAGGGREIAAIKTTTKTYRATGEDRYEIVQSVATPGATPVTTTTTGAGAPPRPERAEPQQSSQEVRATVTDDVRLALAGGEVIEDVEHNEFVQGREEAQALALHRARRAGAHLATLEMPIEALLHKWRPFILDLPHASIHGLKFYTRTVRRDAASFRQSITAEHYPPELG